MPMHAGLVQLGLDLGKATFDNTATSLGTLQGMLEDCLSDGVSRATWVPEPVHGLLREYVGLARRTRADLASTADRCYALLCKLLVNEP